MSESESYILSPRDVGKIVQTADRDGLTDLFEAPLSVITESITGWLASGPKEWVLATGRIVQGAFKARLFLQVAAEINEFRKKGQIPEDFAERENGFQTWVELFTVIDEETPDQERLEALKAMFYAVNRATAADADRILGYQLFQIAKRLNSNELLVLRTVYNIRGEFGAIGGFRQWAEAVCRKIGHNVVGLVELADKALVENGLLTERFHGDRSGITQGNGRLSDLGLQFCANIERYQIEKKS